MISPVQRAARPDWSSEDLRRLAWLKPITDPGFNVARASPGRDRIMDTVVLDEFGWDPLAGYDGGWEGPDRW